jgi:hypothetical protein
MTGTSLTAAEIHKLAWEKHICAIKKNCKDAGILLIFANDNRGKWALGVFRSVISLSSARFAGLPYGQPANS